MRKKLMLLLAALILLTLCSCGEKGFPTSSGAYIIEGKLVIFLDSNPTTGYGWLCTNQDGNCIKMEAESEFTSSVNDPLIAGAGGIEKFCFIPVSEGSAVLHFEYLRSFEENSTIRSYDVSVKVSKGKLSIIEQTYTDSKD